MDILSLERIWNHTPIVESDNLSRYCPIDAITFMGMESDYFNESSKFHLHVFYRMDSENQWYIDMYIWDCMLSINRKLKDCGDDISGKQIKYVISRHKSGFFDGFDLDRYYCDDVMLRFSFSRNKQANNVDEEMLIHHIIEYDFNLDFTDIQQEAVGSIKKRIDYIYLPNVSYLEYSYVIEKNHVQLSFDVLTNEASVSSVVNHLISQDIMIFSRGW